MNSGILVMVMIVYVEYVILDNFVIDYLLLNLTLKIIKKEAKKYLKILSSVIGVIAAMAYPILQMNKIIEFIVKMLTGYIMVAIVIAKERISQKIIAGIIFCFLTFMVGGGIIFIYSSIGIEYSSSISISMIILPAYVLIKVVEVIIEVVKSKGIEDNEVACELIENKKAIKVKGIYDSGNKLYDAESKTYLPIIKKEAYKSLKIISENRRKIEAETIGGKVELEVGRISRIRIYNKGWKEINNIEVAIADKWVEEEYGIILNEAIKEQVNDNKMADGKNNRKVNKEKQRGILHNKR